MRGIVLTPREPRGATLVEHVIECPHLVEVLTSPYCRARHGAYKRMNSQVNWPTLQGLAWWQTSEPQDKNHHVNLAFPLVCNHFSQACIYFYIYCACVVALVIS